MNYDPPVDDCDPTIDEVIMDSYMEKIRDEVLRTLSPMEVAALCGNLKEFILRWREEEDIKRAEASYE